MACAMWPGQCRAMTTNVRRRAAAAGAATLALIIAGCTGLAALDAESVDQVDLIGDARVNTTLCLGGLATMPFGSRGVEGPDPAPLCVDEPDIGLGGVFLRSGAAGASARTARDATRPTHADVAKAMVSGISFHQVLVSYRVPAGAEAPETIEAPVSVPEEYQETANELATGLYAALVGDIAEEVPLDVFLGELNEDDLLDVEFPETVTFTRSDALGDQVSGSEGASADQRWVGYVSEQVPLGLTGRLTLPARFGLPVPADGSPYAGPFEHDTVVGRRDAVTKDDVGSLLLMLDLLMWDEGGLPFFMGSSEDARAAARGISDPFAASDPARPVDCDDEGGDVIGLPGGTVCAGATPDGVADDTTLATNDLRIIGGTVTADQGGTAAVPFTLRFAGPAATQALSLSGGTDLPFATATARNGSWTPAAGETRTEYVDVPVPADARPGVYDVVFAAEVGGQAREAVGRLNVTRASVAPQEQEQRSRTPQRERLYVGRNGTVAFGYVCPASLGSACRNATATLWGRQAGGARAAAAKGKLVKLASKSFRAKPGKRVRVKVKVGPKTRRWLVKAGRRMNGRLVVTAGRNRQTRSILLRRG